MLGQWWQRRWASLQRRWPLILADIVVIFASLVLAMLVRSVMTRLDWSFVLPFGGVAVLVVLPLHRFAGLYRRMWQYESANGVLDILGCVVVQTLILMLVDLIWPYKRVVPLSVIAMMGFFSLTGYTAVRYQRRLWTGLLWRWDALRGRFPDPMTKVLVIGAGSTGEQVVRYLQRYPEGRYYKVVGFVDDDKAKGGMVIHGVPVLGDRTQIPALVRRYSIDLLLLAIHRIPGQQLRELLDICIGTNARIKVVPNMFDLLEAKESRVPIRDITAEDLLGRKPVEIDQQACQRLIKDKVILVTGAAGSVGSELCRQILRYGPRQLLMLDSNESGLYDLLMELNWLWKTLSNRQEDECPCALLLADVSHRENVEHILNTFHPRLIFHAAAYKHVPVLEANLEEAVRINVGGTWQLIQAAARYGVERFVFISTDKAAKPTSVMGMTKRLGEMMVMHMNRSLLPTHHSSLGHGANGFTERREIPSSIFTAVRFGNVLGSRGSVVPLFERQIERGGPVTVTHPQAARYFISAQEAVALIIQAATLSQGGDLFMLDMGEQIKIDELARRLIRLRGLRPDADIHIEYTGLREGEKLEEDLLNEGEKLLPTSHPSIFKVHSQYLLDDNTLKNAIQRLLDLARSHRSEELRTYLASLVNPSGEEVRVTHG